jgi:ABC-type uncharacterized transport system auxiliary subunit
MKMETSAAMISSRTMLNRRRVLHLGLGAVGLSAAGCASDPIPRESFYRLGKPAAQGARAGGPIRGTVDVPPLRASGIVNERAILYRDSGNRLEQYNYHAWVEPPSLMIQQSLIEMLRQAQAFQTVASPDMRLDRDFEFMGDIRQWEHVRGAQSSVAIEIEFILRRVRGNAQLLLKTYQANEPVAGDSIDAVAAAFGRGIDSIYSTLLADLARIPSEAPAP